MILENWKAIFIHIPKTAGGSLEVSLLKKYLNLQKLPYNHPQRKKLLSLNNRWTQHDSIQQTIEDRMVSAEDYFKFSMVRNPWERAVSEYFYIKKMGGCKCEEKDVPETFEDWCKKGFPCAWGKHTEPQLNFLRDRHNNIIMDFIGRFENLKRDSRFILDKFKIKQDLILMNETDHKHYSIYYNDYTKDLIKEMYSEDINYFNYKFDDIKNSPIEEKFYIEALKLNGKKYKGEDIKNLKWSKNSKLANTIIPDKKIDFIFVGQVNKKNLKHYERSRFWILEYIKNNFTENSYLKITKSLKQDKGRTILFNKIKEELKDKSYNYTNYEDIKKIDRGNSAACANPDNEYIEKLSMSKFCLCPAGDAPWSIRFYEAIALKSIPILEKKEHAFFKEDVEGLDYKFYLISEKPVYIKEWADHNLKLFREENLI